MNWFNPKSLLTRFFIIWLLLISVVIAADFVIIMMLRFWYVVLMTLGTFGSIWLLIKVLRKRTDRW